MSGLSAHNSSVRVQHKHNILAFVIDQFAELGSSALGVCIHIDCGRAAICWEGWTRDGEVTGFENVHYRLEMGWIVP